MKMRILVAAGLMLSFFVDPVRAGEEEPLKVGDAAPEVVLHTATLGDFKLHGALSGDIALVVFIRGAWCPYATRQLKEMRLIEGKLVELGCNSYVLSPDLPVELTRVVGEYQLGMAMLSDQDFLGARAFGVLQKVSPDDAHSIGDAGGRMLTEDGQSYLPRPSAFLFSRGKVVYRWISAEPPEVLDTRRLLKEMETLWAKLKVEKDQGS
jgi:peroxiredoxin